MSAWRRYLLIGLMLGVVGVAVMVPSGAVHVQGQLSQKVSVATFDSNTYFFDAGFWGWGVCLSHNDLLSLGGTGAFQGAIVALATGKVAGWPLALAAAAAGDEVWFIQWKDQGNGVCMAWPWYMPSPFPFTWSR
jgi:hypothetical protein